MSARSGHRKLILIGMRGSGKTSVGRALASGLGLELIDCDRRLEERRGQSIRDIFEQHGEARFREWEREELVDVLGGGPAVIATGGGVILRDDNVSDLGRAGFVVYLEADVATLADRVRRDPSSESMRPALTDLSLDEELASVLAARRDRYSSAADRIVSTVGRGVDQIAEEIAVVFAGLPCDD